jgi:hypothetical protein
MVSACFNPRISRVGAMEQSAPRLTLVAVLMYDFRMCVVRSLGTVALVALGASCTRAR